MNPNKQYSYHIRWTECTVRHRMKILLSVTWNISESPLNTHGMFTEIFTFSPTECCWRAGTIQLTIQYLFQGKNSKKFHQISDFKVILLWTTMHEIQNIGGGGSCPLAGSNLGILFLGVAKPVHYHYATQLHISYV